MTDQQKIQKAIENFENKNGNKLTIRGIFFDMDGVLFDSMPNHSHAWVMAFKEFGLEIPIEETYLNEGSTALATAKLMFMKYLGIDIPPEKTEEIRLCKHNIMDSLPASAVMPYMPKMLNELTSMGVENWVVTGSAQNILIDRIETDYSGSLSRERMVTAHDVRIGKPHPEPYLIALEKSGFRKNEVLVVENAPLGVQSGKAAQLFTLALNSGPLNPQILLDSGADLLFHNSWELSEALPEIVRLIQGK